LDIDIKFAGLAADWIDADQDAGLPYGAEDSIYTGFFPPYRAYNRPLTNITELSSLEGMDKLIFNRLLPHVTALPGRTTINVNTATPAVLMSLSASMDESTIEGLLSLREEVGFTDIESTFSTLVDNKVIFSLLAESSEYFQLKAIVQIDTVVVTYFSVLLRTPNGGPVTTILRSLGTI
ncbi:MAG: general secretion pathway protein GspK, partial [Woeseiaceae bacterium]|nr:general secretion pathway protein GspK [Woeseiaceae bacterium]